MHLDPQPPPAALKPSIEPLSLRAKTALTFEVLLDYIPCWWLLRDTDLVRMTEAARRVPSRSGVQVFESLVHEEVMRLGSIVRRILKFLPTDSRCLIDSLVLARILARRSIPSTIVIGVRSKPEFGAHAWVEHAGHPVLPAGEFKRLMEL